MVAAGLQRARDKTGGDGKPLEDALCFQDNPIVDSVLDPDMFARYNDGVLQAALLRACEASELNYSRDLGLSRSMASIIEGVILGRHADSGEAVLEFVLAVWLGKVRLEESVRSQLEESIVSVPDLRCIWGLMNRERLL
jgi:hypothetical protein